MSGEANRKISARGPWLALMAIVLVGGLAAIFLLKPACPQSKPVATTPPAAITCPQPVAVEEATEPVRPVLTGLDDSRLVLRPGETARVYWLPAGSGITGEDLAYVTMTRPITMENGRLATEIALHRTGGPIKTVQLTSDTTQIGYLGLTLKLVSLTAQDATFATEVVMY